uniref:Uncharacterized protein n=1 Tax=Meloidogyne incognita TaxID=6306 RepID=A0A914MBP9_MELIC
MNRNDAVDHVVPLELEFGVAIERAEKFARSYGSEAQAETIGNIVVFNAIFGGRSHGIGLVAASVKGQGNG